MYLFSDSLSKVTRIDEALPDGSRRGGAARVGVDAGRHDRRRHRGRLRRLPHRLRRGVRRAPLGGSAGPARPVPLRATRTRPQYTADAIAVDDRGILFSYSRADGSVLRYDIQASARAQGRDPLDVDGLAPPPITAAGDVWAVVDADDGDVWLRGADAVDAGADAPGPVVVGEPDAGGTDVYLADETALVRRRRSTGRRSTTEAGRTARRAGHAGAARSSTTARSSPRGCAQGDGRRRAVELERPGTIALDYGGESLGDQRRPAFVASDEAVILNETRSGWAWTVPDGDARRRRARTGRSTTGPTPMPCRARSS